MTLGEPAKGVREVAGPEVAALADFVGRWLRKKGDANRIVSGADVPYFGAPLARRTPVPDAGARIMPTRFDDGLRMWRDGLRIRATRWLAMMWM